METFDKLKKETSTRVHAVRLRTWSLTMAIIVTMIFYFLVQVATKQAISLIDFLIVSILQIVIYSTYFPDGELFGQQSTVFIKNKALYNERAAFINKEGMVGKLRDFCEYEYEKRKREYIETQCGFIGITMDELEDIKRQFGTKEQIRGLEKIELKSKTNDGRSKLVFFDKAKRKILYGLIFKEIPVERNHPETIMSAVEYSGIEALKDGSIRYKNRAFIRRVLSAVVVGGAFAYIGFTVRDGFGIAELTSILMYLTAIFTNAVMAYNTGEVCSRVYKNQFHVKLINIIDEFLEWSGAKFDKKQQI